MGQFLERPLFGKRKPVGLEELRSMARESPPDSDGVHRVFSRAIWDDPKAGAFLREIGVHPDDPRNIRKTKDDHRVYLDNAKSRLDSRVSKMNAEYRARYGYCEVAPFLLIDGPLWQGKSGAFLFGQLELCPYDEWNVMLLGLDEETLRRCPVLPHIGSDPKLTKAMEEKIAALQTRYDFGLEHFGLTATGQAGGITREMMADIENQVRTDLMAFVANAKHVLTSGLERFAADLLAGKIRLNR